MAQDNPLTHYIPRRLDDTPKFLMWDFDIAAVALFGFVVGVISGFLFTSAAGGIALAALLSKAKSGQHPGFSLHLLNWFVGYPSFRATPPSYVREYIG